MKHRGLKIGLVVFFAAMVVATVVAENIYYESLPFVTTGQGKSESLTESMDLSAHIAYGRKEIVLTSPCSFSSLKPLWENGEEAQGGIFSVPLKELLVEQKKLELERENLKSLMGGEGLQEEIYTLQLEILEEKIEELKAIYAEKGLIATNESGRIEYLVKEGEPVTAGRPLAKISLDTGERYISVQLPAETGTLLGVGDKVDTKVSAKERKNAMSVDDVAVTKQLSLEIAEAKFLPELQVYNIKAILPKDINLDMEEGTKLSVLFNYKSEVSYNSVVPTSAILFESDSQGYVYLINERQRVYGKEYFVKKTPVNIQKTLPTNTALTNLPKDAKLVIRSTGELQDGAAVKLREEID